MFIPEQKKNWVDAQPEEVAFLASSVNRPIVVPPGRSPEPAQAYICILRTAQGYEFFIYLHLITSNLGLLYKWDAGPISKELVSATQEQATAFTEGMGFMMTDLRWREMTPEQKRETFNSLPLFFQDISRFKEQTEEEVLEIEPVSEEVVVESVEEPVHTVTEGDFVIQEEAFAETKEEEVVFEEKTETVPSAPVPESAQEVSEEDILLEQLEAKEEPIFLSEQKVKAPQSGLIIEMEESAQEEEALGPQPAPSPASPLIPPVEAKPQPQPRPEPVPAQAKEEIIWEKEVLEAPQELASEPVSEQRPEKAPKLEAPTPEPVSAVEEISLREIPEPLASAPSPKTPGAQPIKKPEPEQVLSSTERVQIPTAAPAEKKPEAPGMDPEDFKLILRFLAMF